MQLGLKKLQLDQLVCSVCRALCVSVWQLFSGASQHEAQEAIQPTSVLPLELHCRVVLTPGGELLNEGASNGFH